MAQFRRGPTGYQGLDQDRRSENIIGIIAHWTAGHNTPQAVEDMMRWQIEEQNGSYHRIYDISGNIWIGSDLDDCSWGALDDEGNRVDRARINVAIAGSPGHQLPDAQRYAVALDVAHLLHSFGLDPSAITTHKFHAPVTKPVDDGGIDQWFDLCETIYLGYYDQ